MKRNLTITIALMMFAAAVTKGACRKPLMAEGMALMSRVRTIRLGLSLGNSAGEQDPGEQQGSSKEFCMHNK